jgi:hypothetical protein
MHLISRKQTLLLVVLALLAVVWWMTTQMDLPVLSAPDGLGKPG